jgi:CIC family chloride channel protein
VRLYDTHLLAYFRRRPPGEKRFLLLVPLTGLATGLAAAGLIHLHAMIQKGFWGSGLDLVEHARSLTALHRFLAPTLGGVLVGVMILVNRGVVRGHGTAGIIEAVARGKGFLGIRAGLTEIGAILVTVASGGSLGREGSLLRAGSTLGSFLGRRLGVSGRQLKILVACGAAAGMAAAYNAPIGGAMFALEVVLGSFALESFGPIVIASAIGTLVSRLMISPYLAYTAPPYAPLVSLWELIHFLLLGIGIGLASVLLLLALNGIALAFNHSRLPIWLRPAIGFSIVGLIGISYPEVFGNGYDTVDRILRGGAPLARILLLPLLKVAATAVTRGSGGAGGLFTPTLFMGAVLGSAYGSWCQHAFPGVTSRPGAYALAGMGAMLAGTTQAPFTAIFMIFELTGEYASILPLMVACTAAMTVCRLLRFESIYTQPLVDRGIIVGGRMEELVMDRIEVRDVMRPSADPAHEDDTLDTVVDRMKRMGRKELFVVDDHGALTGAITLGDLSDHLARPQSLGTVRVGDVAYANPPVLKLDDRMTDAIARWSHVSRDRLPVVENAKTLRLVGELSAGDIFTLYSEEILHTEARHARFVRTSGDERPEAVNVELPPDYTVALVVLPESFEGSTLRELSPRARFGVNIIEINRKIGGGGGERRIIPDPDTPLKAGDGLIVVGRPVDIAHLGDPLRLSKIAKSRVEPT